MSCRLALAVVLLMSGSVSAQDDAPAPKQDTSWTVPDLVTVPVGGTGYLKVKIDRKQIKDDVQFEIVGLPSGISVKGETKPTLNRGDDGAEVNFVLRGDADVEPMRDGKVTVKLFVAGNPRPSREVELQVVDYSLQSGSMVVMCASILAVLSLVTFCVWRVLTLPPVEMEDIKGPLEIDTRDTEDAD